MTYPKPALLAVALGVAALLALGASCTAQRRAGATADYRSVSLRQGACFGTCPVFTLTLAPDGALTYDGQQYAPFRGLHRGTVPADSLALVNRLVGQVLAKADELPREIETGIVDYSQTTITLVDGQGDTLTFIGTTEFAEPVAELRTALQGLPQATVLERDPKAEPLPADQLLVTLRAADQIQPLTENYYRQQLKVVRLTSKEPPVFLLAFDPYTMSAEEMVRDLRRDPAVVKVEIVERVD